MVFLNPCGHTCELEPHNPYITFRCDEKRVNFLPKKKLEYEAVPLFLLVSSLREVHT
jgi:hypothetical protein